MQPLDCPPYEEAYRWAGSFEEKGFREAVRERDAPWRDYGERPKD